MSALERITKACAVADVYGKKAGLARDEVRGITVADCRLLLALADAAVVFMRTTDPRTVSDDFDRLGASVKAITQPENRGSP